MLQKIFCIQGKRSDTLTLSANTKPKKPQKQRKVTPRAQLCVLLGKLCLQGIEPQKSRDEERECSLPGVLVAASLSRLSQGWSLSVGLSSAPCSLPRLLWLPDSQGDWGVPRALLVAWLGPLAGAARTGQR